jgi:hypothetical protein
MRYLLLLGALTFTGCATNSTATTPIEPPSLLGDDIDAVRERLGPPIHCTYGGGAWTLAYKNAFGDIVSDAVHVVDDVVIGITPGLLPNNGGGEQRWNGARVEELVQRFGPGKVIAHGQGAVEIGFGRRSYLVADGRVIGTTKTARIEPASSAAAAGGAP